MFNFAELRGSRARHDQNIDAVNLPRGKFRKKTLSPEFVPHRSLWHSNSNRSIQPMPPRDPIYPPNPRLNTFEQEMRGRGREHRSFGDSVPSNVSSLLLIQPLVVYDSVSTPESPAFRLRVGAGQKLHGLRVL